MPKDGSRKQLAVDQGYICAYCMRSVCLDSEDKEQYINIEHIVPQNQLTDEEAIVFCKEVLIMYNLSQGVKAEGREEGKKEGISIGEIGMLVQLVREGDLKPERAAEKAKMTVEEFKKVMENTSNQEV